jgi:glycosyltransferase involved in cell wall biosynthesis
MKVLILTEARAAHSMKWVRALAERNISIIMFNLFTYSGLEYQKHDNIQIISANLKPTLYVKKEGSFSKLLFIKALPLLKKVINKHKPDLMHAHYISSYGIMGSLCGFHPFIISIWGNDIYEFPKKSILHKGLVKYAMRKADKILSTSQVMAKEICKYTNKKAEVTPFGIELNYFKPDMLKEKSKIIIGTIKSLEEKYGLEYLLKAFSIIKENHPQLPLKLLIVGGGSMEVQLKKTAVDLNIDKDTIFTGKISYDKIVKYHNKLSISVFPSISSGESFGVSVIEASACEKPVVVSNVGGLPEVVEENVTGIIVEPKNPQKLANAIEKLLLNEDLRISMGKEGRKRVKKLYNFENNLNDMINIYSKLIN